MKVYGEELSLKQIVVLFTFYPFCLLFVPIGFLKGLVELGIYHGEVSFNTFVRWVKQ